MGGCLHLFHRLSDRLSAPTGLPCKQFFLPQLPTTAQRVQGAVWGSEGPHRTLGAHLRPCAAMCKGNMVSGQAEVRPCPCAAMGTCHDDPTRLIRLWRIFGRWAFHFWEGYRGP